MSEFVNTINVLGDEATVDAIIERTLTEFKDNMLTSVGDYAFSYCTELVNVELPNVTELKSYVFDHCSKLETIKLDNLINMAGVSPFQYSGIREINLPALGHCASSAFSYCANLEKVVFGNTDVVGNTAFGGCTNLEALVLIGKDSVVKCGNNPFWGTKIINGNGYIYVPKTMADGSDGVAAYKAATGWADFGDQIRAIEDYPDICGG